MRQQFFIIVTIALVLGILIVLNAANYSQQQEQQNDSELRPYRSTYNAGPTGTRALYDLLNESGYKVTRWREPASALMATNAAKVQTFVIVGETRLSIEQEDAKTLLRWVRLGGRLVIIDRIPAPSLLAKSHDWTVSTQFPEYQPTSGPADGSRQAPNEEPTARPAQPTVLTREVSAVRLSHFASVIKFYRVKSAPQTTKLETSNGGGGIGSSTPESGGVTQADKFEAEVLTSPAPVVHLSDDRGAVLVDYPLGLGRIVLLSDPYIVSNDGLSLADNLQLSLNTIAGREGLIAFDEYHQGHAATHNTLIAYFDGTPALSIFLQIFLIVMVIIWTRGRRFGRALPLAQVDRRSSLEFVASMAELQQRAHALDLALENIYSRTRRVLTRYAGVDYHSSRGQIAERVASRSSVNRERLESLMRKCEEAINGERISEREAVELVAQLREVERALGLRMRSRDVKQAAESA